MRLTVTPITGDTYTVSTTTGDLVGWETYARKHGLPLQVKVTRTKDGEPVVDIERFPLATYHAFLAHRATYRGRSDRPTLDVWLEGIDDIEAVDEDDDEPTPTRAAPSPA